MNFQNLRTRHLQVQHDVTLYPYQVEISNRIINALNQNLILTSSATEEEIKKLKLVELPIEISRQAGKTTAIVHTVELIMVFLSEHYNRPIHIGIFAPQIEQARTDFERLKNALRPIKELLIRDDETRKDVKEQENAKTVVLPNGSSCYIAPVTSTSRPESKTLDLMIFEEAQDLKDEIVTQQIFPIGASTNAPRVFIGTAGTQKGYFRKLGLTSERTIKIYFEEVCKQRREVFEQTGDAKHLIYEQTIRQEIEKFGLDSDEIQRPYFGKWLIGTGNFVTDAEIDKLVADRGLTQADKHHECFAGLDTAKNPDSTVLTIIRYKDGKKELLNWCELQGENYMNQFEILVDFLSRYNVVAIAMDATGQGDFMPDLFENKTEWVGENSGLYRVKFSRESKDHMYRNLKATIQNSLTTLPRLDTKNSVRFKEQMLDLQQKYVGQFLVVNHPDSANAHDDYADSFALAEWAYAKYYQDNDIDITTFEL